MPNTYAVYHGRRVMLQIDAGGLRLPLHVQLISESSNALRVRLDGRWDVDIPKEMIVRIEIDDYTSTEPYYLTSSEEALA